MNTTLLTNPVVKKAIEALQKGESDIWGDFQTYFKFHIDPAGKIYRLDIGQASY